MCCESMKPAIHSETNAHKEDIPPLFQQWHAAKVIEVNLEDHAMYSPNSKDKHYNMRDFKQKRDLKINSKLCPLLSILK